MALALFAEAIIVLFFGCVQLLSKNKQALHYCMALACLVMGLSLLYFWALETGLILALPFLAGSDIPLTFLAAPSLYLAGRAVLSGGRPGVKRSIPYFAAVAPFALGSVLYNLAFGPAYLGRFGAVPGHFATTTLIALTLGADLVLIAAIAGALGYGLRLRKRGAIPNRAEYRHQVAVLCCYGAASLVLPVAVALRRESLYLLGCEMFGAFGLIYALTRVGALYFQGMAASSPPMKINPEWDAGAGEFAARLEALMRSRSPYRDGSLTRDKLAGMLGVEPERLTYHLQSTRSVSFRGYLNDLRLEAVCSDLVAYPNRSILDTALDAGFTSKTTFNTLFAKKYGMSPRQFRDKNTAEPPVTAAAKP
jgi:AraC-like DNA-binding protein